MPSAVHNESSLLVSVKAIILPGISLNKAVIQSNLGLTRQDWDENVNCSGIVEYNKKVVTECEIGKVYFGTS